ncbi:PLP-dependent transferase [Deinococcus sp. NW-56]|uniref:PLP-dependent transferase n=1 Tax=Deinococcus sp. NW-56 TaxID=2080419 RepID=UPI000CF4417C|nr:PLP-dependent transferase [Deinococcus sp. NW-56]
MSDARDPFPDRPTPDWPTPDWHYETTAVQSAIPRGLGETVGIPIHQAAAFQFATLEEAQGEFAQGTGLSYARLQNPTVRALEERITALEGGAATVALASGQAATLTAILSVCRAGDHVVSTASLFGGTAGLLNNVLPLMGISATLTANTPEAIAAAMGPGTRLVWAETIGNPAGDVPDLAALAEIAHGQGALLGVDNTWGGVGLLCRPLEHGADLVTHSLTKWAGGHGSVMGGSVTVGTRHDLTRHPIYAEGGEASLLNTRGQAALGWRARWLGAHQLGMTLSPHSAFLIAQGLETLSLRLRHESSTALALAGWLQERPQVGRVSYPGLPGSPHHTLARRYLRGGFGAVLTFEVPDPAAFLARLRVIRIAPNLGDTRTLIVHPWTTTHSRLPEAARTAAGVTPRTLRLSVGLEALEDLQADLAGALG